MSNCKNDPIVNVQNNVQLAVNRMEDHIQKSVNRQQKNIQGAVDRMEGNIDKAIENLNDEIEKTLDNIDSGVQQMTEEEKKHAIKNLEGLWELTEGQLLYEDPSKEIDTRKKGDLYLWFRLVTNKSNTDDALYQVIQLITTEFYQKIIDRGASIPINMGFSDKFNSSCCLATMVYDRSKGAFKVTRVDVDDTSIHKFAYKGKHKIYTEHYETGNDGKVQANAFVSYQNFIKLSPQETADIVGHETAKNAYKLTWEKNHENHENLVKPQVFYYFIKADEDTIARSKSEIANNLFYLNKRLSNNKGKIHDEHLLYYQGMKAEGLNGNPDSFYEKLTMNINDDIIIAEANYSQNVILTNSTFTESDQETFLVIASSGRFKGAKKILVEYDNYLSRDFSQELPEHIRNDSRQLGFRRVTVYF